MLPRVEVSIEGVDFLDAVVCSGSDLCSVGLEVILAVGVWHEGWQGEKMKGGVKILNGAGDPRF